MKELSHHEKTLDFKDSRSQETVKLWLLVQLRALMPPRGCARNWPASCARTKAAGLEEAHDLCRSAGAHGIWHGRSRGLGTQRETGQNARVQDMRE